MSNPNYTLEIISQHPDFRNKSLKKYYVDGIETIGAWGNEPFEIKFQNNTWQKIQVKLTLDGTDILTGEPATSEPTKDMWVVNGYGTLTLKAWPETNNGGAQFVFTSADKSVAVHTHGDLSNRGIIAAAVYTEGHVEPIKYTPSYPIRRRSIVDHYYYSYPTWIGDYTYGNGSAGGTLGGTTFGSNSITSQDVTKGFNSNQATFDCSNVSDAIPAASDSRDLSLESLVSVGAGQHVDQKITYVTGLIKPLFTESIRVKYMWWDDLVSKLRTHNVPAPHPSGFPGDKKQNIMSLGSTPRVGSFSQPAFPRAEAMPAYTRF